MNGSTVYAFGAGVAVATVALALFIRVRLIPSVNVVIAREVPIALANELRPMGLQSFAPALSPVIIRAAQPAVAAVIREMFPF